MPYTYEYKYLLIFNWIVLKTLTCMPVGRKCSFTQLRNVFACISTHRSSLPRIFMPLAAVPSGLRATKPAWVIFCVSVLPSVLCFSRPACVTLAPLISFTSILREDVYTLSLKQFVHLFLNIRILILFLL